MLMHSEAPVVLISGASERARRGRDREKYSGGNKVRFSPRGVLLTLKAERYFGLEISNINYKYVKKLAGI